MEKKSTLANIFFNSFGTIFYYGCQWLTTILIVRLTGFADKGIYDLAMTFTAAFGILAMYNTRQYQVSDVTGEYSDQTYIRSRLAAMVIAFAICFAGVVLNGYSLYKSAVILLYMLHKCGEAWIDVYHGIDQKHGRMDYVCYSYLMRAILMLVSFCGVLYLTENLVLAVGSMTFPFMFCYYPSLLFVDVTPAGLFAGFYSAFIGMICLCGCSIGYFFGPLKTWKRVFMFLGVALLLHPSTVTDILGTVVVLIMFLVQKRMTGKGSQAVSAES